MSTSVDRCEGGIRTPTTPPPPHLRGPAGCVFCAGTSRALTVRGAALTLTLRLGYGAEQHVVDGTLCMTCFPQVTRLFNSYTAPPSARR
jgi:hypothetical protein